MAETRLNGLNVLEKLSLLIGHYFSGPLLGFNLSVTIDDYMPTPPNVFLTLVVVGIAVIGLRGLGVKVPSVVLFALLTIALPVLLYAFTGVTRIIIEYRAYMSCFGIAIVAAYLTSTVPSHYLMIFPISAVAVACGMTYWRNRVFASPLAFWSELYRIDPSPDTMVNYSYQLIQSDRGEQVADLILTTPNYRDDANFLINLAISMLGSAATNMDAIPPEKLARALRILEEVVARWPNNSVAWRNLATMHYYNHQRRRAISCYEHAIKVQPSDGLSWFGLGVCYLELGTSKDYAVTCLRRAYEIQPNVEEIRYKFMEALQAAGQMDEFRMHQQVLASDDMMFVTRDMLPPELQEKYDQIIAQEEAERSKLN